MFTKQHYEAIADKTREFLSSPDPIQPIDLVTMLVELFESDNSKFDPQRFVEACGMSWLEYCQE